ncbi:MAG: glycine--tRNA ligase subunit beta [Coleofasciculaceae cyanobacterium SM2_1_6]|nr:glycine--tRNA ligase subunit beta [Coleofasciculaceae cyanobacterium SM2_1_6]
MATFLLEVGTEELPASFVGSAIAQWQTLIPQSLAEASLTTVAMQVYGTPRRLAVVIAGLPEQQPDREEEIKGPPASAAFKEGKPTKAGEGFAKKQGVEITSLEIRSTDKGEFVFINKKTPGLATTQVLQDLIPAWINKLEGKRFMRWGDGELRFSRPVRWLVALWDEQVLPVMLENGSGKVVSDRLSAGHRVLHPQPVSIAHAEDYVTSLRNASVLVDGEERRKLITTQIQAAATGVGGDSPLIADLLTEVVDLVEFPTAVVGRFDQEFLELPPEVITEVMISQQRYFPVYKDKTHQELLPYFMTIGNGDPAKSAIIAAGNERVIRARLADGQYFYKADRTQPLASYLPKLETVTFQADLGSVRAKVDRVVKIASLISQQLKLSPAAQEAIARAALLCKADLVTQMVYEFPELQGIMGEKYALASGETIEVAKAISEHYLPRNVEDGFPQSLAGQVVGLSDRLDTLVSIFSINLLPTGSSDPFALRRAANAIVNITWTFNLGLNLAELLQSLGAGLNLGEFFLQRIRTLLQEDRRIDYDLVNAVLGENDPEYQARALTDLLDVRDRALFLQSLRDNGGLAQIYETVNRSTRLAAQGTLPTHHLDPVGLINPKLFQKKSEQAVYDALRELLPQTTFAQQTRDYQQLVNGLAQAAPQVSSFFDGEDSVLVMDSDPAIKENRLNLLGLLRNHARVLGDFGAIVKS